MVVGAEGGGGGVSSGVGGGLEGGGEGKEGVRREEVREEDGGIQKGRWELRIEENGGRKGRAHDVVGEGEGFQVGSSVQLKYRLRLPDSAGGHVLNTVDWMYLTPNGSIVNRSQFRKFGIQVAELVATMRPVSIEMKDAA